MADSEATSSAPPPDTPAPAVFENGEEKQQQQQLKYLDFVQVSAIYIVVLYSTVYELAKDNSGPLRPGVQTVETAVKTAIAPLYRKFHAVPFQLLRFLDCKLDDWIVDVDHFVPRILKEVSGRVRDLASDVQRSGVAETARSGYVKYEPVAEQYAVVAWRWVNRQPFLSQVAEIMVPTAAYWAEKYNNFVGYAADCGYGVSDYLPLVPVARIAKIFEGEEGAESGEPVPATVAITAAPASGSTDQM